MEEVFTYVSERMADVDTLNFQLRLVGQGALKSALKKLHALAQGQDRLSSHSSGDTSESFASVDLEAAKALAKFGIDALKMAKSGLPEKDDDSNVRKDLFELAAPDPWKLKKID